MKENHLPHALYWVIYSILSLFVLSVVPSFTIGSWQFQEVSLLADLKPDAPLVALDSMPDTLAVVQVEKPTHKIDTCRKGVVCIDDFSPEGNALQAFVQALGQTKEKPVRIAFFGDSFVEGDILTSSLRDTLQRVFGGYGVGFVPITSEVSKFRTTVKHSFEGWRTYSIVGNYEEEPRFGIGGLSAVPQQGCWVDYGAAGGRLPGKISFYYSAEAARHFQYAWRDSLAVDTVLRPSQALTKFDIQGISASKIRLAVAEPDSLFAYGITLESGPGLYVDNLAMRGNSGIALSRISNAMLRDMHRLRPYHLVVLQFGLNVVGEKDSVSYSGYTASMVRVVQKFKETFPDVPVLVLSVSDRSSNQGGTFKTIPGIMMMRKAQKQIAAKAGVAFWDLFAAMGGENSMPKFVNAKPALAAKDYTHLNFKGGKLVAKKLADALLYEKERYEKATAF